MNRERKNPGCRRIVSLLLALVIAITCIPFSVFAAKAGEDETVTERNAVKSVETNVALNEMQLGIDETDPATGRQPLPKASLGLQPFQVYSTYFDFAPINLTPYFYSAWVNYCFLELSSNNFATYTRYRNQYGSPFAYYSNQCSITGLTPNTDYQIRLRATDSSGSVKNGKVFYQITVHTGMPDIQVKSVKLKAVKVKKHKERMRTPYLGLPLRGFWVYYTYKLKVTVKLKKAPGTPGIFINGVWAGGNKKSYTVTFPTTLVWNSKKSPKRRAGLTVAVYSGFDTNWGGYSPLWQKYMKAK